MENQDKKKSKVSVKRWKRLIQISGKYKKFYFIMIGLVACTAVLDAIFPLLIKYAVDSLIVDPATNGELKRFLIYFIGHAIVLSTIVFLQIIAAGRFEGGMAYSIRKEGFAKLQEISIDYYDKESAGKIMSRLTSDVSRITAMVTWGTMDITWALLVTFFLTIIMFLLNVKLALITTCVLPFALLVSYYFTKKILEKQREIRKHNAEITSNFNEALHGALTTKTLLREKENLAEFDELAVEMRSKSIKSAVFSAIYLPLIILLGSIANGIVLYVGGEQVMVGEISLGTYAAFFTVVMGIFWPIMILARVAADFQSAQAASERTIEILYMEPAVNDTDEVKKVYGDFLNPKKENWEKVEGKIKFDHVDFAYITGKEPIYILKDFNLEIKAGEKLALIGETGAGKSTIVNLICRFYEPTSGCIEVDGKDYKKRSQLWLQSNLGYVLQTPTLFNGTIEDNIRYGKLDATKEEIIEVAKTVRAHEFIIEFANGYDTNVGEGGSKLSQGQRQLISFARAIINDPRILILDEATASIDTETEKLIQNAINEMMKGRTTIIVAHRLSTIKTSDRILVIDKGQIVESGSHTELYAQNGRYTSLYNIQLDKEKR